MAWWQLSESIYFDWVLYDMFDWLGAYDNAFEEWTDDKWRSEFAKKLVLREYSDEINESVWNEFERFLPWRKEELERQKIREEQQRREEEEKEKEDREFWEELRRESERPLTPFEEIMNELFDSEMALIAAESKWTEEDWKETLGKKIRDKKEGGSITEETAFQIWEDFKEYMEKSRREREEQEQRRKEKEEEERRKWEQWEKEQAENKAREQRKVKQLPEVVKLIERYQQAKERLGKDASEEAYRNIFDICYDIIANGDLLSCLNEFDGVFGYYEEQVLIYLHRQKSLESLYHVVLYYTDGKMVCSIRDMPERKAHIKKGIPYAELFHKLMANGDSAGLYIDCYLKLAECCRTGEDLEQLGYVDKAYKLSKTFAVTFKTKRLLDELEVSKSCLAYYYRTHEQEAYAEEIEQEFEKIKEETDWNE